jgi:S-layer homology domain
MHQHRSWGTVAAVAMSAVALVVSLGGVALGTEGADLFSDIATSPFREQINRIGRAGCASGFPDGTFQPQGNVNRQQFAFWTNNCGGRVGVDSGVAFANDSQEQVVTEVGITSGSTESANSVGGFVLVVGSVTAQTNQAGCPCRVDVWVSDLFAQTTTGVASADLGVPPQNGESQTSLTVTGVFPIGPEEEKVFALFGHQPNGTNPNIQFTGDLTVLFVPFGADGDRDLDTES